MIFFQRSQPSTSYPSPLPGGRINNYGLPQTADNYFSKLTVDTKDFLWNSRGRLPAKSHPMKSESELPPLRCAPTLLEVKNWIRKRKRMYRKYRKPSNIDFLVKLKTLRNRVVNEIRKSKQEYFDKLEHLLNNEQSNSKLFWKTSKQILNLNKHSAALPTINMNNEYAETSIQKANMLNNYFATQAAIDDSNKSLPRPVNVQHENLATITITIKDVSDVLENLNITTSWLVDFDPTKTTSLLISGNSIQLHILHSKWTISYLQKLRTQRPGSQLLKLMHMDRTY